MSLSSPLHCISVVAVAREGECGEAALFVEQLGALQQPLSHALLRLLLEAPNLGKPRPHVWVQLEEKHVRHWAAYGFSRDIVVAMETKTPFLAYKPLSGLVFMAADSSAIVKECKAEPSLGKWLPCQPTIATLQWNLLHCNSATLT